MRVTADRVQPKPAESRRWFGQALAIYRQNGFRELLRRARFQIVKRDRQDLYALRLAAGEDGLPANLSKVIDRLRKRFEVSWLSRESGEELAAYLDYRTDLGADAVNDWLSRGHRTVIVHDRGRIVGDGWIAFGAFPFPDASMAAILERRGYAFTFLANVLPEYGGLGVFPLIVDEQVRASKSEGRVGLIGTVSLDNLLSGRSVEKMGFRPVGTVSIWWLVGRKSARAHLTETL